jgi:outer membrane immunogenic protein
VASAAAAGAWSGPYAGLFAGYGRGDAGATEPYDGNFGFFYNFTGNPYSYSVDGALAGAVAGYNWQRGRIVTGIEGEIGYFGLNGSAIDPNGTASGTPDTTTTFRSDGYGALNLRLGVVTGGALLYVKGGVAALNARASTIDPCIAPPTTCGTSTLTMQGSKTMVGWSLGGGVEWALGPRWTAKLDYTYFDFGSIRTAGTVGPAITTEFYTQSIDVTAHTVKVGVNYRW